MKNNKRADSIAWIIIAVFILSFALMGIINVLDYNKDVSLNYEKETWEYLLKSNAQNLLKKVDISEVEQNQEFYINKNSTTNQYEVLTWTTNERYKYIDIDWNNVDPSVAVWKTYERYFQKKIDILRHDIKPPEIDNLVFHFDASNIDWNKNISLNDGDKINRWRNLAWTTVWDFVDKDNVNTWNSIYSSQVPSLDTDWLNNQPMVAFNWVDEMLAVERDWLLNNNENRFAEIYYSEKSYAIVFKTWDDIINRQVVYEQWGSGTWYNFYIEDWDVWAWVLNYACDDEHDSWCTVRYANIDYSDSIQRFLFTWDNWHKQKSVRLWEVLPNTIYFVMIVQDSSNIDRTPRPIIQDIIDKRYIDNQNKLKIYLNWILADEIDHVDPMPEHSFAWIWNVFNWSVTPAKTNRVVVDDVSNNDTAYFKWGIWEIISRNHALTDNEVRWVQNYFSEKWLWWTSSIRYDVVNTYINEYKQY